MSNRNVHHSNGPTKQIRVDQDTLAVILAAAEPYEPVRCTLRRLLGVDNGKGNLGKIRKNSVSR